MAHKVESNWADVHEGSPVLTSLLPSLYGFPGTSNELKRFYSFYKGFVYIFQTVLYISKVSALCIYSFRVCMDLVDFERFEKYLYIYIP